jgi:hypothetical protein
MVRQAFSSNRGPLDEEKKAATAATTYCKSSKAAFGTRTRDRCLGILCAGVGAFVEMSAVWHGGFGWRAALNRNAGSSRRRIVFA